MKSLLQHFRPAMEEGIRASKWFRTAPEEFQRSAKIKILGVEDRKYFGLGTARMRPALIAECECPDGPRYKALGNSWAVPNVRWIGRRIAAHLIGEI